jgi:hypothetical protein
MKKFLAGMLVLFVLAITVPITANAQKCYKPRQRNYVNYNDNYRSGNNRNYRQRSFYKRHQDKINIGAGGGAGALIGAVLGGKKGAVIGALIGGGSAAVYTYKIRKNRNR